MPGAVSAIGQLSTSSTLRLTPSLAQALKGHGAPARLVVLPHESHGYQGRESVMHALYEQDHWLSMFCAAGGKAEVGDATMPQKEEEKSRL